MGELGALFNPGMRHELEERQAKAARREEEGNARDGDLRIDLESGVAVINVPGSDDEQDGQHADADNVSNPQQATPSRPSGRHAAEPADETEQSTASTQSEASTEPAPPVLRPRGKRGMSAANR